MLNTFFETDKDKMEKKLWIAIEAIENKDKNAFKGMFSKKALRETKNIDYDLDILFGFFQGKVESWEGGMGSVGDNFEYGHQQTRANFSSRITTDKQEYSILIIDYPTDTFDPDNVGFYTFLVMYQEDAEEFDGWQNNLHPGITIWKP